MLHMGFACLKIRTLFHLIERSDNLSEKEGKIVSTFKEHLYNIPWNLFLITTGAIIFSVGLIVKFWPTGRVTLTQSYF